MTTEPRFVKNGIYRKDAVKEKHREPKPAWLKVSIPTGEVFGEVRKIVKEHKLHTVCEEAMCPNIAECWSRGTATFMLMGHICTRACRFCAVDTGNPMGRLDVTEPYSVAESVQLMSLRYVVLTSVDRDDLPDGGAYHFARTVEQIKKTSPETRVEALTPDFGGNTHCVDLVLNAGVDVYAQNLETVRRLTHPVRDIRASYDGTLAVLAHAKAARPDVYTKTSIMLGLGETHEEILEAMRDCRAAGVDVLTFGQYLRPTEHHLKVERYVTPEEFAQLREIGLQMGFVEVVSGPLVRSSYKAEQLFMDKPGSFPEHLAHLEQDSSLSLI
ncbi:lipoyl synthase [Deinococcus peraridilitoris]|uniref:Lipoyl synthase n=1 Tax=Deinococcus peraridilitoris (strain DSM 19664 / LMG 22246 / CIP 109416 / KR-200) TaxID=937777 RepID=K9ZYF4_DEIPD|nr:lipoyl synthase [Deinococcus peraridilitoris]AFZ66229.1 lipoate synthase [Deinococcus peraridilitoris DSM 19664]